MIVLQSFLEQFNTHLKTKLDGFGIETTLYYDIMPKSFPNLGYVVEKSTVSSKTGSHDSIDVGMIFVYCDKVKEGNGKKDIFSKAFRIGRLLHSPYGGMIGDYRVLGIKITEVLRSIDMDDRTGLIITWALDIKIAVGLNNHIDERFLDY